MICSKCGKIIKDDAQFCNFCGTPVEQPPIKIKKKKKTPVIILVAIICLAIVGGGLFFFLNRENPAVKTNTSRIEANLANWGYGCEIGEDTYISFPEGILKVTKENIRLNEAPENVYASDEGISQFYSDFVSEGETIYCLSSENADNKTIYHFQAFDVSEKKMYQLCTYETPQTSSCYALNKIENKIYYYVDGSLAYIDTKDDYKSSSVSLHSTGISTGNNGILKVTDSGVFCSSLGDKGLKLLSYDGKVKYEYEKLEDKKVGFWYEKDGKALITLSDEDKTLYVFDTKSGDYSKFTDEDVFADVMYMQQNWFEDTIFISMVKYIQDEGCYKYFVYAFSSDGKLIQTVCNDKMNDFGFANMLILNDIMYISNPISGGNIYSEIYELPSLKAVDARENSSYETDPEPQKKSKDMSSLCVVTCPDYEPFAYLDSNSNIIGYDIDLVNKLASDLEFTQVVVRDSGSFDGIMQMLDAENSEFENVIAVDAIAITEERTQNHCSSTPYYSCVYDGEVMEYGIFSLNNDAGRSLIERINKQILEYKANGYLEELAQKWHPENASE